MYPGMVWSFIISEWVLGESCVVGREEIVAFFLCDERASGVRVDTFRMSGSLNL